MNADAIDLARRRILIVEDDYFLADELARAFRAYGAEIVGPVGTIETALDVVSDDKAIDLAVLDINLRGHLVYPVADVLRDRGVSFVFATGYDPQTIPTPYDRFPYLPKPTEAADIAAALGRLHRSRAFAEPRIDDDYHFRLVRHGTGWGWELYSSEGELLASGMGNSSAAARVHVFRAAHARRDH